MSTGCEYWPAREGSWIKYDVNTIWARWDEESSQISVIQRTPHAKHMIEIKWMDHPRMEARYFNELFSSPPALTDGSGLGNMVAAMKNGVPYVGENGRPDRNFFVVPPEPKIPVIPQGGESLVTRHTVFDGRLGRFNVFPMWTRYRTVAHYDTWGGFSDVWRTGLEESPTKRINATSVYNYAFAKGIGLVNFWYCAPYSPDTNGISEGYEYYATEWKT